MSACISASATSPVSGDPTSAPSSSVKPSRALTGTLTLTPGSMTKVHSMFSFDSGGLSQKRVQQQRKERWSSIVGLTRGPGARAMRELRRRSSLTLAAGGGAGLGLGVPVPLRLGAQGCLHVCLPV